MDFCKNNNFKLLQKPLNTRFNLRNVASDAQEIFAQVLQIERKLVVNFLKQALLTWGCQCSWLDLYLDNRQFLKLHNVQVLRCSAAECYCFAIVLPYSGRALIFPLL